MNGTVKTWALAIGRFIFRGLEAIRKRSQPTLDRWVDSWQSRTEPVADDFVADADSFIRRQDPLRARFLIKTLLIVVSIAVMWSALATFDEFTKGEGKVIPSRQLQVLQSLDGGIVVDINVREGQTVDIGDILLQVDPTRFESSVKESDAQFYTLQAKAARLRAIAEDKPFIPPPDVIKNDPRTVEAERRLYEARTSELNAQLSIARQQLTQRQQELAEMRAKREQASRAYELSSREYSMTKPLFSSGAVSEVELLRLERDVTRFGGERDMAGAQIARSQAAIAEASRKIEEVELNFRNEARKELAETQGKLNALGAGQVGLADKVKHTAIRSPVRGTVKRLLVNTVGGVVQPGKDLVEVVPLEDSLLLEAKVSPKDIAFLRPGQPAIVRFTAYDFSVYGGMDAVLEHIGADTITDERGNTYYVVRVRTRKSQLAENLPIIPGMVAEVDIVTGKKSFLTYLLKPVLRAKHAAFTER